MDRHEVLEFLEPLLDGELSEDKERELHEFLATDPACRREYDRLVALSQSIGKHLPQLEAPPYLRGAVEEMANRKTKQRIHSGSSKNRWVQAAAACFAVAVCALILLNRLPQNGLPLSLFVLDHMEYSQREEVAELKSGDLGELESWFKVRLPFTPRLPALPASLEGGRLCHIGEERVALAFYNWNGDRVSLFVGDAKTLNVKSVAGVSGLDRTVPSIGSERGHSTAVWSKSGLTYVIVATCPEEELEKFVKDWRSDEKS